jgi:glucokinase
VSRWVGIDIGGQSMKCALVDGRGRIVSQTSRATGPETDVERLAGLCREVLAELGVENASSLGAGVAGCVTTSGVVAGSPNLPYLAGVPLARELADALALHVLVDNDAHCHALAEAWTGAAVGVPTFLLLTLGSGIGSALVIDGRVYHGTTGFGCELGHMIFRPGGRRCTCGNHGCLEAYLSEVGLRHRVMDEAPALGTRIAERAAAESIGHAHALFDLSDRGDAEAADFAIRMVEDLGTALASLVNTLDVELVVLGGGIAPGFLARSAALRRAMAASLFARAESAVRIEPAVRGALAGAVGAARMAMLAV